MEHQEQTAVERVGTLLRHPLTCILLLSLSSTVHLNAGTSIRSITIRGNDAFSKGELLDVMTLKPRLQFSAVQLQGDLDRILALYHENGYYFAHLRVDSLAFTPDSGAVDITLSIAEGEQALVGEMLVEGNSVFATEDILEQFDTRIGKALDGSFLERDIDNLLRRYEQAGHPFAQARIARIELQRNSSGPWCAIVIGIDEGTLVRINEIRIEGNKDTKASVIVRETRYRPGEPYNEEKTRTIPRRLERLNIFSSVSEPELYVNSQGGGLLIRVQEGPTSTFDGVAGYVPGSAGESGFLTGMVNIGMRNLFGTGRKLNARWQREDRLSQEVAVRYAEPWVLDVPINLAGSFFQRQQDTTYVRRTLEFRADVLVTENLSLGGLYNHENVIPASGVTVVFGSSTITTGAEVQYDSRDDVFSPTSGLLYRSDYRIGRKKIFGLPDTTPVQSQVTVQKISLDFEWLVKPFLRQVVMLGLHGRELRSEHIGLGDLYRFGGANTMRGYRENQFLGSRVVWSNTEYRFLLARRSFVFGFFDAGYYFRPEDNARTVTSIRGLKYGYGIGIRLETGLGNIGVSFALGEGDSFSQGKLHFGLINEF